MKLRSYISLLAFVTCLIAYPAIEAQVLTPHLQKATANNTTDSLYTVVIIQENSSPELPMLAANSDLSRASRIKSVVNSLRTYTPANQQEILDYLTLNSTTEVIRHWVIPAYTATLPLSKIEELSGFDDVVRIVEDIELSFESPVKEEPAPMAAAFPISDELNLMHVPSLWHKGIRGSGSLVCSFDTGVDVLHPALQPKWRGNHKSLSSTWFSKIKPDTIPYDASGHGTHTMGIMVGGLAADSFGVAPEAEWITAGVIDQGQSLSMTISDILQAFQWALNPDGDFNTTDDVPDVILNSWGIPKGLFLPCDDTFWGVIDNVEAAGIVTIFAAGNEGPEPMTMRSPADRATTGLNAFSVGAVNILKEIANFSSRGPSSCDQTKIKPEVVAPGVSIRSSTKGGGYSYMSGTSMAAPYVAGVVALIRQYNPDATVTQIKQAFINSAQDLGGTGEDNAYGHGFLDVENILSYIPSPYEAEFNIASVEYVAQSFVLPGETCQISITLTNPIGNIAQTTGKIVSLDKANIVITANESVYFFGNGGTFAQNISPYILNFDSSLYHGQEIQFALIVDTNSTGIDTIPFSLTVGYPIPGSIYTHSNEKLSVSVSDFGQFGFASGSSYNVNGFGFAFNNSGNLLYESGLIVSRSPLQISTSIRNALGAFKPSDFTPVSTLNEVSDAPFESVSESATFSDENSELSIPVKIYQQTTNYTSVGDENILLVEYTILNNSIESMSNISFGMFHDFDLSASDQVLYDETYDVLYQTNNTDRYIGIVPLKNIKSFKVFTNGTEKSGWTKTELASLVADSYNRLHDTLVGDMMVLANATNINVFAGSFYEIAYAFVCGNSLNEMYENAVKAKQKYDMATSINDSNNSLPEEFLLHQNYPNPFNPTTTISFTLPNRTNISLEIYNVLGQKVRTLYKGDLAAGMHQFEWNATDNGGNAVASGIYFYRLSDGEISKSQKMTLLK